MEADLYREDVVALADELDQDGPVELLVNNVGITTPHRVLQIGADELDLVLGTNLRGPWLFTDRLVKALIEDAGAHPDRVATAARVDPVHLLAARPVRRPRGALQRQQGRRVHAGPGDGQGARPAPDQGERDLTRLDPDRGGHQHPGAGGQVRAACGRASPPARPASRPTSPGSPCSCSATPGRAMSPARTWPSTAGCPSTTGWTSSGPLGTSATRARPAYTSSQRLAGTAAARAAISSPSTNRWRRRIGTSPSWVGRPWRPWRACPGRGRWNRRHRPARPSDGPGVGFLTPARPAAIVPGVVHRGRARHSPRIQPGR